MTTTMNMSGYEVEREVVLVEEYGEEVMLAEWNPQLAQVSDLPVSTEVKRAAFPPGLANVDVDTFLHKMYEHQR